MAGVAFVLDSQAGVSSTKPWCLWPISQPTTTPQMLASVACLTTYYSSADTDIITENRKCSFQILQIKL